MAQKTKMQTEEENNETKRLRKKEETAYESVFVYLNIQQIMKMLAFIFLFSLRTCSKSLKDIYSTTSILLAASFKHLRTDRATECVFRASRSTLFENFPTLRQPRWCLHHFNECTALPEKNSGHITCNFEVAFNIIWLLDLCYCKVFGFLSDIKT